MHGVSVDFDVEREAPDATPVLEDLLLHYQHEGRWTSTIEQDAVVRCLLQVGALVNRKILMMARAGKLLCADMIAEALRT
jgi:hypothetical protein